MLKTLSAALAATFCAATSVAALDVAAPTTISPQAADALTSLIPGVVEAETAAEMAEVSALIDAASKAGNIAAREQFPASIEEVEIAGRTHLMITPETVDADRADHLILHVHGGAHVFFRPETTLTASLSTAYAARTPLLSVDYPLAWEAPFPASRDLLAAVYEEVLREYAPENVIFSGESAGGGLILTMLQKLNETGRPMPAAAALLSPWVDISDAGDSILTLKGQEPVLDYEASLANAARLYAGDLPLTDPGPSPLYAAFDAGLPPVFLTTGTRDLFLSGCARLQRRLMDADVPVEMIVYEGMWHVFQVDHSLPETHTAWRDYARFVDRVWPSNE